VGSVELIATGAAALSVAAGVGATTGLLPQDLAVATGGLALAGLAGTITLASARPDLQLFGPAVLRGPTDRPLVALSFDDGPDPASTDALVDALDAADARATFFLLADRARRHPDLLARLAERQELALHGPTHSPWLTVAAPEHAAARLRTAAAALSAQSGQPIRWYRPPFGVTSPRLHHAVALAGLRTVWCSLRTGDGGRIDGDTLRQRCARAGAGDIVLMHDGARPARDVLPRILDDLRDRGLSPCTVGELLEPRP